MPKFAAGAVRFQADVYPEKKALFERLAEGQSPDALFIACSDSRVETAMITQTDPGELFICRNPGNIVPPNANHTGGTAASIEFAMSVLEVPHVVVCGHTGCGAMKAAMNPDQVESFPHLRQWISHTHDAVKATKKRVQDNPELDAEQVLLEQNVILQLTHLRSHPTLSARLADGAVKLHGWVYDIGTGIVHAYDEQQDVFVPASEFYADDVAKYASVFQGC